MVHLDVGDGMGDDQQELPSPCHVLGAVRGVERDRRLHPLMVGRRSQRGVVATTARRSVLTMRLDVMSQEPLNMMWSYLRCSFVLDSES
jgi:hypothetical protein